MSKSQKDKLFAQDGRIDPANLDAAARPKRRRRKRNRPEPTPELREWEKKADRRAFARPYAPGAMIEFGDKGKEELVAPHNDDSLWTLQLADAFGTRSRGVINTFMQQLEALCEDRCWDEETQRWRLDENELSAVLAMVNSIKPKNEMEAALAAQMVAVHLMTMKVSARALAYDHDTHTASVAAKLARTFAMQIETLHSVRGKRRTARQSIKVTKELHQHVHYHRGEGKNGGQAHGPRAATVDQCTALPGPEQGGEALSLPSYEGQSKVPDARRR